MGLRAALVVVAVTGLLLGPSKAARANSPILAIMAGGATLLAHDFITHPPSLTHTSYLAVSAGDFDVIQQANPAFETSVSYRWGHPILWRFKPFVGFGITSDAASIAYGGLRFDEPLTRHWFAGFDIGIALYGRGHGKNLGSAGLGRSGLSLGYRFDNGALLEASFHHMSHDGFFSNYNPGVETATLTAAWPLG